MDVVSAGPPLEAAGRRVRARRRTVVIALALVVVLTGLTVWGADTVHTHQRLDRTRAHLQDTSEVLGATQRSLRGTQGRLTARERDLAAIRQSLARALDGLRRTSSALANRTTELGRVQGSLKETQTALVTAFEALGGQSSQIESLEGCLKGVTQALNSVSVGDRNAAVTALAAVAGSCQEAEAVVSGSNSVASFPFDFPDPFILKTGATYYGFSTNSGAGNIQVISSNDLLRWTTLGDALPQLPSWAVGNATWGPSVLQRDKTFVLYFSAPVVFTGKLCIGRAVSLAPQGPYVDASPTPLVCQLDRGGSIDPSPLVDYDGALFLTWASEDGPRGSGHLWSQRLTPDGQSTLGPAALVLGADQRWEGTIVEGPTMVRERDRIHLFYSGNFWNSRDYGVGYAACETALGPCHKVPGPVLTSVGKATGPGGPELFTDTLGIRRIAYHSWTEPNIGYPNSRRLRLAELTFKRGRPAIAATG